MGYARIVYDRHKEKERLRGRSEEHAHVLKTIADMEERGASADEVLVHIKQSSLRDARSSKAD